LLDDPEKFNELFWLLSNYTSGILPEGGGLEDQPHRFVASIRLLQRARKDAEEEREEREKRRTAFREKASRAFNSSG
jgi:hypothetical protein